MQETVSVIIPTYNQPELLQLAVRSVLSQTYAPFEVLIVDDGSTHETEDVARGFGKDVVYVKRNNGGTAAARNEGVRLSRGEYIAFLDHDDLWTPDKLERQMPLFEEAAVGMTYTAAEFFDHATGRITSRFFPGEALQFHDVLGHTIIALQSAVFRREVIEKVGLFDETLRGTDDWDYCIRTAAVAAVRGVNHACLRVRLHSDNQSGNFAAMHRNAMKVLHKNRAVHGRGCSLCKRAAYRTTRICAEDHYTKLAELAKSDWSRGSYWNATTRAAQAYSANPVAICRAPRVLRRLLGKRLTSKSLGMLTDTTTV